MKIIKSWLKEYIDPKISDIELAEKLVDTGTEVEKITKTIDNNVVVAKILSIKSHPNADKLQIAEVFDGKDKFTVVCGAKNIKKEMIVPFARIGSKIGEFIILEANLRGVASFGMLCSAAELGTGDDHTGIMELPNEYSVGKPLNEYLPSETIFELEISSNRGDCQSHIGIAREIGAFLNKTVVKPPIELTMSGKKASELLNVSVEDQKLCSQYQARVLDNVTIGPSPKWLVDRLALLGLSTINNVVDVTNYVMFDLGQPLHAFDYNKVDDKVIIVRKAKKGEKLITLDDKELSFLGTELVIADKKKPIAIAGVMGGLESGITATTKTIVLESAAFNSKSIRKTSKELNLKSDASYRFERGVDEGGVEYALNKAAKMIKEFAGGSILSGIVKEVIVPIKSTLNMEYKKINTMLGTELKNEEIDSYLKRVGIEIKDNQAVVPLYRHDIFLWQDIAEEVGRIYGYSNIKKTKLTTAPSKKETDYHKKEYLKDNLEKLGFSEVLSYSFLSERDVEAAKVNTKGLVEIANPVQPENKFLRNSLIPKLLFAIAKNPSFDQTKLFEIGSVFSGSDEHISLAVTAAGKNSEESINSAIDFVKVTLKDRPTISTLDRDELKRFKIKKPLVTYFELNLSPLLKKLKLNESDMRFSINKQAIHYRPVSRFPSITRDLAFVLDKKVKANDLYDDIYEVSENINRVELFDEFASDKLGKNKKNLAFHLYIQDLEKTMNDKEADEIIDNIIKTISKKYNAKLRTT